MALEARRWCTVPWARKGRAGELGTKPVGIRDGWVRWAGCAAVWEAGRAVRGGRHPHSRIKPTARLRPRTARPDGGIFIPTRLENNTNMKIKF